MKIYLETERLYLREFTPEDVDHLVELDSDPEVMRYLTGGKPTPREQVESRVLPRILEYYERLPGFGYWAAIEKSTGAFAGWFHLRPAIGATSTAEVELGYRLRRSAWGKGFATEGSRALIRKAFTELGVLRVTAQTMAVNRASRRVMEKCGLILVRRFWEDWEDPIPGSEEGDVEYAVTRAEWQRAAEGQHPRAGN